MTWQETEQQLHEIYNPYSGEKPDPELVKIAIMFVSQLAERGEQPPFRTAVSPNDDAIGLEWQSNEEYRLAEITIDGKVEWMRVVDKIPEHWEEQINI